MKPALSFFSLLAFFSGCGDGAGESFDLGVSADLAPPIGADTTVVVLDKAIFSFANGGHLDHENSVELPGGLFSKITLHVDLACPPGGCDPWDRIASLSVVEPGDGGADTASTVEIGRFITPYGVKGSWDLDVTELAPLLTGTRTLRGHIETYAKGWMLSASLVYVGGVPSPEPLAIIPLKWSSLPVGDPSAQAVDQSLPPQQIALPDGATGARVRLLVTGHGQGNYLNCAEFCDLDHRLLVDGKAADKRSLWRNDCASNPVQPQKGNWQSGREGWCPGADVKPWTTDLGPRSSGFTVAYAAPTYADSGQDKLYVNTCSPGSCTAASCEPFVTTACTYNGNDHTSPSFAISALVIAYR